MTRKKITIYCLSFFLPIIFALLACFIAGIFPFSHKSFLYWDVEFQYLSYLGYFKSLFTTNNDIFYTFARYGGENMLDFTAYYLLSPTNLLLFFFPEKYLNIGVEFLMILRLGLLGLTFSYFLNKEFPLSYKSIIFALTYALCGYNLMNISNIIYFDSIILLPFVLIGINKIVKNNNPLFYLISIFAVILSHAFIGYMFIIFAGLFLIYKLLLKEDEKLKTAFKKITSFVISSVLAAGLNAWLLIPVKAAFSDGKYTYFDILDRLFLIRINIIDIFSKFYTGTILENEFWAETAPYIFIGILSLLLMILFFFNKNFSKREKLVSFGFLLVLFLSFTVNFLFVMWNMGVENPNGTIYRFSFLFDFFALILGYKALQNTEFIKPSSLIYTALIFLVISALVFSQHYSYINIYWFSLDIILGLVFLWLFYYMVQKSPKYAFSALCAIFLLHGLNLLMNTEYSFSSQDYCHLSKDVRTFTQTTSGIRESLNYIKEHDKGLYKIETQEYFIDEIHEEHLYYNTSLLMNFDSVSQYSSFGKLSYKDFLSRLGYYTLFNNFGIQYVDSMQTLPLSLLNVKYILSANPQLHKPYIKIFETNNYKPYRTLYTYENPYALPLCFLVGDKRIKDENLSFEKFPDFQNYLLKVLSGKDFGDIYNYKLLSEITDNFESENAEKRETRFDYTAEKDGNHYLLIQNNQNMYIPFMMSVSDKLIKDEYSGLSRFNSLYLGNFKKGEKLSFDIFEDIFDVGIIDYLENKELYIYLASENLDALKNYYDEISHNACDIKKITSSHLKGNCEVNEDNRYVFISLPYDKGWRIKIDGKETKTFPVFDHLTGFSIPKGAKEIDMRFRPSGFNSGLTVSAFSFFLVIIFLFIRRRNDG
ncbi:YfhO family protein [bacterium]|nr:YfhO family protein [bacterium]